MMNDDELNVEPQPEEIQEAPAPEWDFSPPKQEEKPLTRAELMEILNSQKQEEDPDFEERLTKNITSQVQGLMSQQFAQFAAPMARQQLAQELSGGNEKVAEGMMQFLGNYDANAIAMLRNTPHEFQALKLMAKGMKADLEPRASVPNSNPSKSTETNSPHIDRKDVEAYARMFGKSMEAAEKDLAEFNA